MKNIWIFRYFIYFSLSFRFKSFVEKLKYSKSNVLTFDICSFNRLKLYDYISCENYIVKHSITYTCIDIFKLKGNGKY